MRGNFPDTYADTTNWILTLGILMGTSSSGTSSSPAFNVTENWIYNHTGKVFFFGRYGASSDWGYQSVMNQFRSGALVRLGFGRYRKATLPGTWYRKSGHAITMAGHNRADSGGTNYFFVTDPADDNNLNSQSPFSIVAKETTNLTLNTVEHGNITHGRYTLDNGTNNDKRSLVDNMHAIIPAYAGWQAPSFDATMITIKFPFQMNPITHQEYPTQYTFSTSENLQDWCIDPTDFSLFYLNSTGQVKHYDHATQSSTTVLTTASARKLAIGGPNMDLYVVRQGTSNDSIIKVRRSDGSLVQQSMVGHAGAIDVDDSTGGLVALDAGMKSVTEWDAGFTTSKKVNLQLITPIYTDLTIQVGEPIFSIDSATGDYFVATAGNTSFQRFHRYDTGHRIGIAVSPRTSGILDLTAGPAGLVFVRDASNMLWTLDTAGNFKATDFSGMQVGSMMRVARSFSMFKQGELTGPGWIDEPPTPEDP